MSVITTAATTKVVTTDATVKAITTTLAPTTNFANITQPLNSSTTIYPPFSNGTTTTYNPWNGSGGYTYPSPTMVIISDDCCWYYWSSFYYIYVILILFFCLTLVAIAARRHRQIMLQKTAARQRARVNCTTTTTATRASRDPVNGGTGSSATSTSTLRREAPPTYEDAVQNYIDAKQQLEVMEEGAVGTSIPMAASTITMETVVETTGASTTDLCELNNNNTTINTKTNLN